MKIVEEHISDRDVKLDSFLWSFRTSYKVSTSMKTFRLVVCGLEAIVPMEYVVPSLRIAAQEQLSHEDSLPRRLDQFQQLEEDRATMLILVK